MEDSKRGLLLTIIGTFFFGTSAIFTRLAVGVPAVEIASLRLFAGSFFIYIAAKFTGIHMLLKKEEYPKFLIYGLITAFHFYFYNQSLFYTTIAHSLSLVYLSPIFVTILTAHILKEKLPAYKYAGIVVTLIGVVVLAGFEPTINSRMLLGDFMAVISAICYALYSVAGRRERNNYPLLKYVFWVYLLAAIFLLPFSLAGFVAPVKPIQITSIILLGLMPTALGHTLYNAGVRYVHPTYANLISTQEVTFGVILGVLILNEMPGLNSIIGIFIMFAGLAMTLVDLPNTRRSSSRL
ncbi:MAG: DMT family transporter [Clostridiales bacterium]|nr:DMT family transporter [Clostridiales bacterium]